MTAHGKLVIVAVLRDGNRACPFLVFAAESAIPRMFFDRVGKNPCEAVGSVFFRKGRNDTVFEMHPVKVFRQGFFNRFLTADILPERIPPQHDLVFPAGLVERVKVEE